MNEISKKIKVFGLGAVGLLIVSTIMSGFYIVQEGTVGVEKRLGEVTNQVGAGLKFKIPFIDDVEKIEVRTRINKEQMAVATKEQMKAVATVSVNWTVNKESVKDLYINYGGLEQFESRVLDPKLRAEAKEAISKFTAEENINIRGEVSNTIYVNLSKAMEKYPITIDSVQYENIELPEKYLASIDAKQTAKNMRDAEQYNLEKQNLEAQRAVNTARADAESIELKAQAEAKATILKGEAEAQAIDAKGKALRNNPLIVDLTKAQRWNGVLPTTNVGGNTPMIMNLGN